MEVGRLRGHNRRRDIRKRRRSSRCLMSGTEEVRHLFDDGSSDKMKTEVEPTRGVEQHNVLARVDAAFVTQRRGDLLCSFVQLNAGRRADCYTLKNIGRFDSRDCDIILVRYLKEFQRLRVWCFPDLGVKEHIEHVVCIRLCPPLQRLRQILMLKQKTSKSR